MVKTQLKRYEETLSAGNVETAQDQFKQLARKLDKVHPRPARCTRTPHRG
jgi:ribosomal protein S20